jgi:hypothetical protein
MVPVQVVPHIQARWVRKVPREGNDEKEICGLLRRLFGGKRQGDDRASESVS